MQSPREEDVTTIIALSQCLAVGLVFPLAIYNFFSWRPHKVIVLWKEKSTQSFKKLWPRQKDTKPNHCSMIQLCH